MLTHDRLREILRYDPCTGVWTWVSARGRVSAGATAGHLSTEGYRVVRVDGQLYKSSRLAFLYVNGVWPTEDIDHRDLNRANDRWENIREATHSQNQANKSVPTNNLLGVKGVTKKSGKFRAQFGRKHLGYFSTPEAASEAYQIAAKAEYGEFARHS